MTVYMLDKWSESDWRKAEDEIFEKLAKIDSGGFHRNACQRVGVRRHL